jgi:hypothetical protein
VFTVVGEYSVLSKDREGGVDWVKGEGRFAYPPMIAAIGEAIFALAMERNPHVVKLSSYAPLFQNWNAYQWTVSIPFLFFLFLLSLHSLVVFCTLDTQEIKTTCQATHVSIAMGLMSASEKYHTS